MSQGGYPQSMRAVSLLGLLVAMLLSGCADERRRPEPIPTVSPSATSPGGAAAQQLTLTAQGQQRGHVILLHGGGWRATPSGAPELLRPLAEALSARGYTAQVVVQAGGQASLSGVLTLVEETKAQIGELPLCLYGESSGGHLALLAAAALPEQVSCVVASAAPLDLLHFPTDTADHRYVLDAARAAFGPDLSAVDPLSLAPGIRARALLIGAVNDPLIPVEQLSAWEQARPNDVITRLPVGKTPWIHSPGVDQAALEAAGQQALAFVDEIG